MSSTRTSIHGEWSSRLVFILAATGSAVGLGNIWKFPYITGENGGGAFVLVYLLCIACIGIPIMMAEVMLGRKGRQSPINTMRTLAAEMGQSKYWCYLGWAGMLAGFLILSYYSVIAGWALAYIFRTGSGVFVNVTGDGAASIFSRFVADPEKLLAWHTLFMVMTTIVVSRGVSHGLEKAVRVLMPTLFVLLLVLVGYAMNIGEFAEGIRFLFDFDFSELKWDSVLTAMGHAFFTLSLGMGAIMMYGSYLPKDISIAKTSITIALMDTLVALLAGMAIFPLVFANALEPGSGPGLIFQTLPIVFGHMPGGTFFGTLFFILLVFAAWTSAISLIEPGVTWLVENRGHSRIYAATVVGLLTWLIGLLTVFSFNIGGDIKLLSFIPKFENSTMFDLLDYLTSNIMLPLGGLLIAIFAGWFMNKESSMEELGIQDRLHMGYRIWLFLVKFVAPLAVIIVFLKVTGIIDGLAKLFH
ncbi:MAG: sodium-dependent transporter [Gammaproteobacteria bacterium]|nr:sodium-dependent transporter [Gammaproteobacteria bacterium]